MKLWALIILLDHNLCWRWERYTLLGPKILGQEFLSKLRSRSADAVGSVGWEHQTESRYAGDRGKFVGDNEKIPKMNGAHIHKKHPLATMISTAWVNPRATLSPHTPHPYNSEWKRQIWHDSVPKARKDRLGFILMLSLVILLQLFMVFLLWKLDTWSNFTRWYPFLEDFKLAHHPF